MIISKDSVSLFIVTKNLHYLYIPIFDTHNQIKNNATIKTLDKRRINPRF